MATEPYRSSMSENPYEPSQVPADASSFAVRARKFIWPIVCGVLFIMWAWAEWRFYDFYNSRNDAWADAVSEYTQTHPEFREFLRKRLQ